MGHIVNVEVNVDIDLEGIETEDLQEELQRRNQGYELETGENITEMFYAFKLGREDRAIELAKKIACDHTGMIL